MPPKFNQRTLSGSFIHGRVVACLRREVGLSQGQLANAAGLGHATIARVETGRTSASVAQAVMIEVALMRQDLPVSAGVTASLMMQAVVELRRRYPGALGVVLSDQGTESVSVVHVDRIVAATVDAWLRRGENA